MPRVRFGKLQTGVIKTAWKKTMIKKSESAEKIRYGKRSGFSWQN